MKTQLPLAGSAFEPLVRGAYYALDQHGLPSKGPTSIVMVADSFTRLLLIHSKVTRPGHPEIYYVRTAMYRLPLDGVESLSTKCPTEKTMTEQEYVKITPVTDGEVDPLELMKLTKRLVLCTSCGNLRLIN